MRVRTAILVAAVFGLLVGLVQPAGAGADGGAMTGFASANTGFTSDNVEWVSVNPLHTGTAGGRLVDGYFYVTDPRGVYIYDVTEDPAAPTLVGWTNVFQSGLGVALAQEDPDTNGEILLVDAIDPDAPSSGAQLLVVDVSDKSAPGVIGSVDVTDHTWTCVLDCTYAYGRSGNVVDLTDPTNPIHADVDWRNAVTRPSYTHDFTEVRPGFLVSSGQPSYYLDVRDPLDPVELNRIDTLFYSLGFHGARWPNQGTDDFLLMGTEISPPGTTSLAGSDCNGPGGLFTYDATEVLAADAAQAANPDEPRPPAQFKELGSWRVESNGVYADGNPPGHVLYCEHWFDAHPDFDAGGLVAMGHYTWGTRFLEVDEAGQIEEIGWFQPVGGFTGAAYWITDEIVYVTDYVRGLEILRVSTGES